MYEDADKQLSLLGVVAAGISQATPHYRNFSVLDLSISYPLVDETIPAVALAFIAGVSTLNIGLVTESSHAN